MKFFKRVILGLPLLLLLVAPVSVVAESSACDVPKAEAVPALDEDGRSDKVSGLISELNDSNFETRVKAGIELKKYATAKDVPALVALLKKGNPEEAQLAILYTLAKLRDTRASQALSFELEYGTRATKRAAVIALGEIGTDWPIGILFKIVRDDKDPELRRVAASALGRVRTDGSVHALNSTAKFRHYSYNAAVDWALLYTRGKLDNLPTDTKFPGGLLQAADGSGPAYYFYHGVKFYFYQPALRLKSDPAPWMLVGIHEKVINPEKVFADLLPTAKKNGLALLVPVFDNMKFPEYYDFNLYGARADRCLSEIIEHVSKLGDIQTKQVYLYGLEGGGEFVERYATAYPEKVARAIFATDFFFELANDEYYPFGIKTNPIAPDLKIDLDKFAMTDTFMFGTEAQNKVSRGVNRFSTGLADRAAHNGVQNRLVHSTIMSLDERSVVLHMMQTYFFDWRENVKKR